MTAQPDWRRLSLKEQVARLVVVRGSGHLSDGQRRYPRWELPNTELQRLLHLGVGGVILLGGSAAELRLRTGQLRDWAGHPLLLCADVEEGSANALRGPAGWFRRWPSACSTAAIRPGPSVWPPPTGAALAARLACSV